MFEETPRTFENVVQRDVWLWKHLTVGLLTEIEQYRLLNMPNPDADRTTATQWQNYARSVAELLAKQGRWAEVQAYYLASMFTMSHANKGRTPEFWETATEAVRLAGYSAGMPPVEEATTMAEVVAVGIKSSIMPVPESIVRSLVIIGTIRDSVYDEAELSGESRRIFSQLLPTVYPQIKTSLSDANGSHEQFRVAVSAYSNNISQLRTLIDQWSENQTVEHIRRSRESLLKQLARINDYLLPYDKNVVVNIQKLLGTHFSSYEKSHAELQEDVGYEQLLEFWKSYFENIQEIGSHFSSCYAAPLMLSVGEAITGHYQGLIHSKYPDLLIQIVKPAARQAIDLSRLDIEIRNEGTAPANNCDFHIKASADECVFSDFPDQYIGTLGPNESKIVSCGIRCEVDQEVFELPCSLEWNDRSGSHSKDDILKITRQRDIDWAAFTALPAPYTIQSITNPSKLKGRNDLLQNLRLGFLGNASFMVTGQKRVGKTSLIRVFLSELAKQDGLLTLYVPLGELSAAGNTDDVGRLGVDLVQRIVEEYEERFDGLVNIPIPPVAEFRDAFNTTFTRFIRQFLKVYPVRLAFAIDDLDELPTQLFQGSAGKAFFLALRSLIDRGTSFFFIGSERLPGIMKEQAERLNQVKPLIVDYLDRDALDAVIREPVKDWLQYSDEAVDEIDGWSARNPFFTTLICNSVWERTLRMHDYWIGKRDVTAAVNELVEKSDPNYFKHFWSDSPFAEDEDRGLFETKSGYVILALSKFQLNPFAFVEKRKLVVENRSVKAVASPVNPCRREVCSARSSQSARS